MSPFRSSSSQPGHSIKDLLMYLSIIAISIPFPSAAFSKPANCQWHAPPSSGSIIDVKTNRLCDVKLVDAGEKKLIIVRPVKHCCDRGWNEGDVTYIGDEFKVGALFMVEDERGKARLTIFNNKVIQLTIPQSDGSPEPTTTIYFQ